MRRTKQNSVCQGRILHVKSEYCVLGIAILCYLKRNIRGVKVECCVTKQLHCVEYLDIVL